MSNKVYWQTRHWRQAYLFIQRTIGKYRVDPRRITQAMNGCYDSMMTFVTDGLQPDEIIVVVDERYIYVVGVTPTPALGSCREFHVDSLNADPRAWQDAPGWTNDDAAIRVQQPILVYA